MTGWSIVGTVDRMGVRTTVRRRLRTESWLARAPLAQLVEDAARDRDRWETTVRGIPYGAMQWDDGGYLDETSYYWFLAAFADLIRAQRVYESGTHHGGSARAIRAGMRRGTVVTFDVAPDGVRELTDAPGVEAHQLDGGGLDAADVCRRRFGGARVDLAFVDCDHWFWATMQSVMLAEQLGARWLLLDDITLEDREVGLVWERLVDRFGDRNAIDVTSVLPDVRPGPGLGLVRMVR